MRTANEGAWWARSSFVYVPTAIHSDTDIHTNGRKRKCEYAKSCVCVCVCVVRRVHVCVRVLGVGRLEAGGYVVNVTVTFRLTFAGGVGAGIYKRLDGTVYCN